MRHFPRRLILAGGSSFERRTPCWYCEGVRVAILRGCTGFRRRGRRVRAQVFLGRPACRAGWFYRLRRIRIKRLSDRPVLRGKGLAGRRFFGRQFQKSSTGRWREGRRGLEWAMEQTQDRMRARCNGGSFCTSVSRWSRALVSVAYFPRCNLSAKNLEVFFPLSLTRTNHPWLCFSGWSMRLMPSLGREIFM